MLYYEDFEKMRCAGDWEKRGMWLHGKCHMEAGVWARYENGSVRISCKECGCRVAEIAVAKKEMGR